MNTELVELLEDFRAYLEGKIDVEDRPDGCGVRPNEEMKLDQRCELLLSKLEIERYDDEEGER